MRKLWWVSGLLLSVVVACGGDDDAAGGDGFPAVDDFAAPGPFAEGVTTLDTDTCLIGVPPTLGNATRRHPVILWGNGTGVSVTTYQQALGHWASHGFIVAAAKTTSSGSGAQMIACLDYVLAQDTTAGSVLEGRVDAERIGASGHSQGGAGTLMAALDERVSVTAPLQPFIAFALGGFQRTAVGEQTVPMLLLSGSDDDIASRAPNQQPIFDEVDVPVFWGTLAGADHLISATGNISGYRGPTTAWFRYYLMDDVSAGDLFFGADCSLCSDAAWTVETKNLD